MADGEAKSGEVRRASLAEIKRARAVLRGQSETRIGLEGRELVLEALRGDLEIELVVGLPTLLAGLPGAARRDCELCWCDEHAMRRLSSLRSPPGLVAICRRPPVRRLEAVTSSPPDGLWLAVVSLQDPGNLGALARVAEAAAALGLVLCGNTVSPWNSKALRGSAGSLLRLPVYEEPDPGSVRAAFDRLGVEQRLARPAGGADPRSLAESRSLALWIGPESGDLPAACDGIGTVSISMGGPVESLNLAVAAGILLYAAGSKLGDHSPPQPRSIH